MFDVMVGQLLYVPDAAPLGFTESTEFRWYTHTHTHTQTPTHAAHHSSRGPSPKSKATMRTARLSHPGSTRKLGQSNLRRQGKWERERERERERETETETLASYRKCNISIV